MKTFTNVTSGKCIPPSRLTADQRETCPGGKDDAACNWGRNDTSDGPRFKKSFLLAAITAFLSALFFLTAPFVSVAGPADQVFHRRRLIVLEFDSGSSPISAQQLTRNITNEVLSSGRFDIISRGKVNRVLRKGQGTSGGIMDIEDALRLGDELKADFVLMGNVVDYDLDDYRSVGSVRIGNVDLGGISTISANVNLYFQIIDVRRQKTLLEGEVLGASSKASSDVNVDGYTSISLGDRNSTNVARNAVADCVKKLGVRIVSSLPLEMALLEIRENRFTLDGGKNQGVSENRLFDIYARDAYFKNPRDERPEEDIIPTPGETMNETDSETPEPGNLTIPMKKEPGNDKRKSADRPKGRARIIAVDDKTSTAQLMSGDIRKIVPGDVFVEVK